VIRPELLCDCFENETSLYVTILPPCRLSEAGPWILNGKAREVSQSSQALRHTVLQIETHPTCTFRATGNEECSLPNPRGSASRLRHWFRSGARPAFGRSKGSCPAGTELLRTKVAIRNLKMKSWMSVTLSGENQMRKANHGHSSQTGQSSAIQLDQSDKLCSTRSKPFRKDCSIQKSTSRRVGNARDSLWRNEDKSFSGTSSTRGTSHKESVLFCAE
jgi:hypothetical protein